MNYLAQKILQILEIRKKSKKYTDLEIQDLHIACK